MQLQFSQTTFTASPIIALRSRPEPPRKAMVWLEEVKSAIKNAPTANRSECRDSSHVRENRSDGYTLAVTAAEWKHDLVHHASGVDAVQDSVGLVRHIHEIATRRQHHGVGLRGRSAFGRDRKLLH